MDLKTVKTFQMIVKYGSFHRAAEEMNYVQSTVTMQIQKLESELGVTLLERGKKIRLTEAGRLFYEQSLPIVKQMEQLQTNMSDLLLGESGNIRLGVTEPTASYRLPHILKKFTAQYPNIRISLEFGNTPGLTARLLQGELDLALGSAPELGSEIYFEPLFQEEFVLLMPEDHSLASLSVIVPENLRDDRLLITSEACPYRKKLEMVLQEAGNIPIDTMEIGSMTALKFYVESGLGIALVPKIMVEPVPAGTTIRTLSGSLISMNFGILSKPSEYPTHQAGSKLYRYLKQELLAQTKSDETS